jgi:hypothetical protein
MSWDNGGCVCGGFLVSKDGWEVCASCGGATTKSGEYLPPESGWAIPKLTKEEVAAEWGRIQHDEDVRAFWRVAF